MLIGAGSEGTGGAVLLFESPDLLDWTYVGRRARRRRARAAVRRVASGSARSSSRLAIATS